MYAFLPSLILSIHPHSFRFLMVLAGGLDDVFVDLFGYQHKICDLYNGYTHQARSNLIFWEETNIRRKEGATRTWKAA